MSLWTYNLFSKIYTLIKQITLNELDGEYADITFTTTDLPSETTTKYPTVYIHKVSGSEIGMDLENKTINGIYMVLQVEVITNKSQKDANKVMDAVMSALKMQSFTITEIPTFENGTTYYRSIIKAARSYGDGDEV